MSRILDFLDNLAREHHNIICLSKIAGAEAADNFQREFKRWSLSVRRALQHTGLVDHLAEYEAIVGQGTAPAWQTPLIAGVAASARECVAGGFAGQLRHLLHAEMFDSLASQAKELLRTGHKIPAAVLLRIVIERWIRDQGEKSGVPNWDTAKASVVNDGLKTAGVFSVPKWRQVQGWTLATQRLMETRASLRKPMLHGCSILPNATAFSLSRRWAALRCGQVVMLQETKMGRKKGKPCYYCGAPSVSVEHGPARLMFRGFDCDSITVPSCDKHNSAKCGNDQAIVSAFLIPLVTQIGRSALPDEVLKAISIGQSSFERAKRKALSVQLVNDPPFVAAMLPNVGYIHGSADISGWVNQLTVVLVCNARGSRDEAIDWGELAAWSPDLLDSSEAAPMHAERVRSLIGKKREVKAELDELLWMPGWSAFPRPYPAEIYQFSLHFPSEGGVLFWHRFYSQFNWYVILDSGENRDDAVLYYPCVMPASA